jgi:tetratricopeptide (TPR) repeat protein
LTVLGDFHLITGDYDEAVRDFQQSLEIAPEYPLASELLGDTYLAKGEYAQAQGLYERCLNLASNETQKAHAHYLMGKLDYLRGKYPTAIQECQQALGLDSTLTEAHWILGLSHVNRQEYHRARSEIMAIEGLIQGEIQDPKTYYYHLSGQLSLSQGMYDQALEDLGRAASIKSLDRAFSLCALGEACFKAAELDTAIRVFQEVLTINPNYAQAHYLLGQIYEKIGRREDARAHFQKLLDVWKDADEDIPQFVDAKRKLKTL